MYKPNSLDQERASWTTVVYFNVVHSLKHILTILESWDDSLEGVTNDESSSTRRGNGFDQSATPSPMEGSPVDDATGTVQIANLRRRLSPLIVTDEQLANRLSGGITVSGSGKGSVFVRSGWQARTIETALGRMKKKPSASDEHIARASMEEAHDPLVKEVGRMLQLCESDIQELWNHPTVKGLMAKRKLKLDEWAEL